MAKWHGYGRCKTRLAKDIGKNNSAIIQKIMTKHTVSVAKFIEQKKLVDISLAISGLGLKGSRRWANELGVHNFNLQGRGCLGEKMKRQIIANKKKVFKQKLKNMIFIGTDLPDLCHLDILHTLKELKNNDLILGPSSDGGYWLIALSEKILSNYPYYPFINIRWSKEDVLENTIENFSSIKLNYKLLQIKTDLDTFADFKNRG